MNEVEQIRLKCMNKVEQIRLKCTNESWTNPTEMYEWKLNKSDWNVRMKVEQIRLKSRNESLTNQTEKEEWKFNKSDWKVRMKVEQIRLKNTNNRRAPSCSFEHCDVNIYIKYWKNLSENLRSSICISFMRTNNESYNLERNPCLFIFTILKILLATLTQNDLIPGQQNTCNYSLGPLRKTFVHFCSSIKSNLQWRTCEKLKVKELRGEFVPSVCQILILTGTPSN
jgi:hypothetical protein